jgi:hypothetical protein
MQELESAPSRRDLVPQSPDTEIGPSFNGVVQQHHAESFGSPLSTSCRTAL